jgi:hypothetical protein
MDAIPRITRGLVLRGLIIDFPAMAQQADRQHFLLAISLVNDPVVAHTKLEETGEGPSEGFGLNGVKVLGKPAELLQHAASHHVVEVFNVLGRPRAELDLLHLPFQAPAASQFSRGNVLALKLRLLKVPQKALLNLGPKGQACIGISQQLTQLFLDYFADHGL